MASVTGDAPAKTVWAVPRPSTVTLSRPTYLMDGDCGFCRGAMARVLARFPGTFDAVPYQDAPLGEWNLTPQQCSIRGHFLVPDGDRVCIMAGGQSWAGILQQQRGPWRALGNAMGRWPLRPLTEITYRWVATHRGSLGFLVRDPSSP